MPAFVRDAGACLFYLLAANAAAWLLDANPETAIACFALVLSVLNRSRTHA